MELRLGKPAASIADVSARGRSQSRLLHLRAVREEAPGSCGVLEKEVAELARVEGEIRTGLRMLDGHLKEVGG